MRELKSGALFKARHHQRTASEHKMLKKHYQSQQEAQDGDEWASGEEDLDLKRQKEMEIKESDPGRQQTTRNSGEGGSKAPQQPSNNLHSSDATDERKRHVSKSRKFTEGLKDKDKQQQEDENEEKDGTKKQR